MCDKKSFFKVSDSEIIEICKKVYRREIRAISPNHIDGFLLKVKNDRNFHIVNISGDMNCEFPISVDEINGWFELIENLISMLSPFLVYCQLKGKNKDEFPGAKEFLDFLRKEQKDSKFIKDKKFDEKIAEIYNAFILMWKKSNNIE